MRGGSSFWSPALGLVALATTHPRVLEFVASALRVGNNVVNFGAVGSFRVLVVEWRSAVWAVVDALFDGDADALSPDAHPSTGSGS